MTKAIEKSMELWLWPWTATTFAMHFAETLVNANAVVTARLPMIQDAWANPFTADHREMTRMVSEKIDAFGHAQRINGTAQQRVRRATEANARALGRMSGGTPLGLAEWMRIGERNLEILATLAAWPTAALAPIHSRVTANARRLTR